MGIRNLNELRRQNRMTRTDMRMGGPFIGPKEQVTSDDIPAMLSDGEFVQTAFANNGLGGFKSNLKQKQV